jgi:hypothetical protein
MDRPPLARAAQGTRLAAKHGACPTGQTAPTSTSSELNRVGRWAVTYTSGLEAHNPKRPAPTYLVRQSRAQLME